MAARGESGPSARRIAIFDDGLFVRSFRPSIPGYDVVVLEHADDAAVVCAGMGEGDWIFMDHSMGMNHQTGTEAVEALRLAGVRCQIIAMSSDPAANERMVAAGANRSIAKSALEKTLRAIEARG